MMRLNIVLQERKLNSDKQAPSRQRGNVMIYILIALGLIGALTIAMTRQADQSSGENLDKETIQLQASKLQAYTGAAQNVINQMMMSGTTIDNLELVNPTSSGFNTGSHIHKLFHPSGGGLNYEPPARPPFTEPVGVSPDGWYVIKSTNVEWTPSSATDVILAANSVDPAICAYINQEVLGLSPVIPTVALTGNLFTLGDMDLTTTTCPACENLPQACVGTPGVNSLVFYTILEAR
jgi:hypothetical protein